MEHHVIIVSGRPIDLSSLKSGEESFLKSFIGGLEELGYTVILLDPTEYDKIKRLA